MILIAGIFLALVGVFTETYLLVHWLVALVYFVVFPLGAIALTHSIRNRYNRFFISTTVLSLVSLAIIMTGVLADLGPLKINNIGLSVFEMSEAILLSIWSIYLSIGYYYQKIKFS
jgi:hypothetical membrane protein